MVLLHRRRHPTTSIQHEVPTGAAEATAGVQLAASVAGDQGSSLRPVSASSAVVEDAVRERKAAFAGNRQITVICMSTWSAFDQNATKDVQISF